jgi:hypothetical protein
LRTKRRVIVTALVSTLTVLLALTVTGCTRDGKTPSFRQPSRHSTPTPISQTPTAAPQVTVPPQPLPSLAPGGNVQRYLSSTLGLFATHTLGAGAHPTPPLLEVTTVQTCTDPNSGQPEKVGDQAGPAAPSLLACDIRGRLVMAYSPQGVTHDAHGSRQQWLPQLIIAYQYFLRALHDNIGPSATIVTACLNGLIAGGLLAGGYISPREADENAPILDVAGTGSYYLGLRGRCTA